MQPSQHPLWNAGFRPLFLLAAFAGVVFPIAWLGMLHGIWAPPGANPALPGFSAVQWHAHEMFFGFGGAVLIGFLLTASKNWVGIAGYRGRSLIVLTLAWWLERASLSLGGAWPASLFWLCNFAFVTLGIGMVLHTLVAHRARDSYRADNVFFLLALPLLLPAKLLLLLPDTFQSGIVLTQGVFRLAFLLMLERTVSAFMKNGLQLEIAVQPAVDRGIKWLALLLCAASWLPESLVSGAELLLAILLFWRLRGWYPRQAMSRLDIGIMYVGYLALTAQLLLAALTRLGGWQWVGSLPIHVFTVGTIGCIAPAMFIRIANGHTGRRIVFGKLEKSILWLMIFAFAARTLLPQLLPGLYLPWLDMAASAWALAFALWLFRFLPFLLAPRTDGKPG